MDTDLVIRAQRGDKEAYALLATEIADRHLAVARRILRDLDLAEDATQQALLAIWRDLPQLRDPARFEAWSYRLLVRACYAEGRKERRWAPNLHLLPSTRRARRMGSAQSSTAISSRADSAASPSIIARWWCCITTSTCRSSGLPSCSASRSGRPTHVFITRCAGCARRSTPTRGPRRRRLPNEHRSRHHAHRPVVAEDR